MRSAITWAVLVLIASTMALYLLGIRPALVNMRLQQEANDLAEKLAAEITFVARSFESGVVTMVSEITVPESRDKHYEVHVDQPVNGTGKLEVWVVGRTVLGETRVKAEATYYSGIPVMAPPKLYGGRIYVVMGPYNGTFQIRIANVIGSKEGGG